MIPTLETICEDLKAGTITIQQALAWLYIYAEGSLADLRNDFAKSALTGILAANMIGEEVSDEDIEPALAHAAYRMADAMLKARLTE